MISPFLQAETERARWLRLDTAELLKRFYFCERALALSAAAWLPYVEPMEIKTELPRFVWQGTQNAGALRERVFELRFPSRTLEEEGADRALAALFHGVKDSPSSAAFLLAAGEVLLPALADSYRAYLQASDVIADGPTHRFLALAAAEKEQVARTVSGWARAELESHPYVSEPAARWATAVREQLDALGGVGVDRSTAMADAKPLAGARRYSIPDRPARDPRYWPCRFYWPDIVDASFPYGEGLRLQLRSAVSHLNEVWAIETGGIILSALASELPWEWIRDAARWTYDESRHCRMGVDRLAAWGFEPAEIPLGTYIYDSAAGQDPIYRLGMLYFFETKNIRHKPTRAALFHDYGDKMSQHDMEFDWADETLHASYGHRWLRELLAARGQDPSKYESVRDRCGELVKACVVTATTDEVTEIKRVAGALVAKAEAGGSSAVPTY